MGRKVIEAKHTIRELFNMLTVPEVTEKVDFSNINQAISQVDTKLSNYKTSNDAALNATKNDLNSYKTSNNAAVNSLNESIAAVSNSLNTYKSSNNQAVSNLQKAINDTNTNLNNYKTSNDAAVASKVSKNELDNSINFDKWSTTTTLNDAAKIGTKTDGAQKTITPRNFFYSIIDKNMITNPRDKYMMIQLRRVMTRGENLGSYISDEQKEAIRTGTFTNIYVGDYWAMDNTYFVIVDINYFHKMHYLDPHLVIIVYTTEFFREFTLGGTNYYNDSNIDDTLTNFFVNLQLGYGFSTDDVIKVPFLTGSWMGEEYHYTTSDNTYIGLPSFQQICGWTPTYDFHVVYGADPPINKQFAFFANGGWRPTPMVATNRTIFMSTVNSKRSYWQYNSGTIGSATINDKWVLAPIICYSPGHG